MVKFWIATRPSPGMDTERFDYEWGVMHTSLMVTTPTVLRTFERYVQHRSVLAGVDDNSLVHPRSPEGWYSCAEHICRDLDAVINSVSAEDYRRRMFGHRFSDKAMVVEITSVEVLHDQTPSCFGRGGVKVINFVRRRDGVSQEDFIRWWREKHAPVVLAAAALPGGPLLRYVQNPIIPMDASFFKGTLFELGHTGTYAGVEELCFETLAEAFRMRKDPAIYNAIVKSESEMIDPARCFGMVVVERVVFNFIGDGAMPRPAIQNQTSLESAMVASECQPGMWNVVRPMTRP